MNEYIVKAESVKAGCMYDDLGVLLEGIQGGEGAKGILDGAEMGLDIIAMQPFTEFPLHTHEGSHVLYILEGEGRVHIEGVDYAVYVGDSVFIPADLPHGVLTSLRHNEPFKFLAIGYPHHLVESTTRMQVVRLGPVDLPPIWS
jgi:mannose-6-phosphate isomerase-like protein (cupin superfamily)